MGILPRWSIRILESTLSTPMTSLPLSAKQAPATSPTYPVPTTAIFNPMSLAGYGVGVIFRGRVHEPGEVRRVSSENDPRPHFSKRQRLSSHGACGHKCDRSGEDSR